MLTSHHPFEDTNIPNGPNEANSVPATRGIHFETPVDANELEKTTYVKGRAKLTVSTFGSGSKRVFPKIDFIFYSRWLAIRILLSPYIGTRSHLFFGEKRAEVADKKREARKESRETRRRLARRVFWYRVFNSLQLCSTLLTTASATRPHHTLSLPPQ